MSKKFKITSVEYLWDFIAYAFLYSPNYPKEDYLKEEEQLDLEKVFEMLRGGITIAYPEDAFADKKMTLNKILDLSFDAFANGEDKRGRELLQDFRDNIFSTDKKVK